MPAVAPQQHDDAFLKKVRAMYGDDPALKSSLEGGLSMQADMQANSDDPGLKNSKLKASYGNLTPLFRGAGKLLAAPDGPRVAVLDASGWDTHVAEGGSDGQLARRLQALDQGIAALKTALGPAWKKTAVVMATEFGRTVRPNGANPAPLITEREPQRSCWVAPSMAGMSARKEWVGLSSRRCPERRPGPTSAERDLRALFKGASADQEHGRWAPRRAATRPFSRTAVASHP